MGADNWPAGGAASRPSSDEVGENISGDATQRARATDGTGACDMGMGDGQVETDGDGTGTCGGDEGGDDGRASEGEVEVDGTLDKPESDILEPEGSSEMEVKLTGTGAQDEPGSGEAKGTTTPDWIPTTDWIMDEATDDGIGASTGGWMADEPIESGNNEDTSGTINIGYMIE